MVDPVSAQADLQRAALAPVPVFAHELPDDQNALMPRQCLVVAAAGGPGTGGYLPLGHQRLDFKAYGATHAEAMDVAIAAHLVAKNLRRTVVGNALIHSVDPQTGYITLREPDGRWPLVLRSYLQMYDEREVA